MNKEKFLKLIKSFLKFIGVCIGSYFILSLLFILFFIISLLISFVWPSLLVILEEMLSETKLLVMRLAILMGTGCSIILFYLSKKFRKIFKFLIISSFFVCITLIPIRFFLFPPFTFNGNELEPYLKNGQTFLIQKFDKSIKRGDIVMFFDKKMAMIFGLPGEKVEIKDGVIFINDQPLENINYNLEKLSSFQSVTVPEDSFFCFLPNPKNKNETVDLSFGICKKSEIKGKVFLKF
jgi:signal peptidase I